jgi:putative glutathione S-transferase
VPFRSGFSTSQEAYTVAQADLKAGLHHVENILGQSRFLMGPQFTDADLRLFPTIVRHDAVYNCLFKCARYRIAADFPNIQAWMQDVWLIGSENPAGQLKVRS